MLRRNILFFVACQALTANAQADATHLDLEAFLVHDSNIGRSEYSQDTQEDTAIEVGANISRSFRLTEKSGLVARAGIQLTQQAHYDDLSQLALNAGARYRIQPVSGFTMPWLDFSVDVSRLEHENSPIRDGWLTDTGIAVGKYFTDRLKTSLGWVVERRIAEEGRVFDLRNRRWHLDVDFQLTPQGTLYARAARTFGDQVSSSPQSTLSLQPLQYSAKTQDDALSEHYAIRSAYRFDAVVNSLELGYNHAINGSTALDFSASYFDAMAKGGHTYEGYAVRAGLLYQF